MPFVCKLNPTIYREVAVNIIADAIITFTRTDLKEYNRIIKKKKILYKAP